MANVRVEDEHGEPLAPAEPNAAFDEGDSCARRTKPKTAPKCVSCDGGGCGEEGLVQGLRNLPSVHVPDLDAEHEVCKPHTHTLCHPPLPDALPAPPYPHPKPQSSYPRSKPRTLAANPKPVPPTSPPPHPHLTPTLPPPYPLLPPPYPHSPPYPHLTLPITPTLPPPSPPPPHLDLRRRPLGARRVAHCRRAARRPLRLPRALQARGGDARREPVRFDCSGG